MDFLACKSSRYLRSYLFNSLRSTVTVAWTPNVRLAGVIPSWPVLYIAEWMLYIARIPFAPVIVLASFLQYADAIHPVLAIHMWCGLICRFYCAIYLSICDRSIKDYYEYILGAHHNNRGIYKVDRLYTHYNDDLLPVTGDVLSFTHYKSQQISCATAHTSCIINS